LAAVSISLPEALAQLRLDHLAHRVAGQLVDDLDSLRDAIASDVLREVPADALRTSLDTLVEVKERIKSLGEKSLGEAPDTIAAK